MAAMLGKVQKVTDVKLTQVGTDSPHFWLISILLNHFYLF